jgi:ribosomal subunit interface protein
VDRTERVDQAERLDIVVKSRHTEVSDRFREHVREKIARLGRLDPKAYRVDVEICHETNPRMSGYCDRVELTLRTRGPVVRAEAAAQDPYGALDLAAGKLEERLRRAADRRRARHSGHAGQLSHGRSAARPERDLAAAPVAASAGSAQVEAGDAAVPSNGTAPENDVLIAAGSLVVREKAHDATPMSLDDALHHMELVGHDFYLFCDADGGLPSVVYRRRGYTYGVLRLKPQGSAEAEVAH